VKKILEKNRRAFTLVELLAILIILIIIFTIAIPTIRNVISNTRGKVYKLDEQMMVKVTKKYVVNDSKLLPKEIGEKKTVTLPTLVSKKYIEPIRDPYDNSIICDGYVNIKKNENAKLEYEAYLVCGDNYKTELPPDTIAIGAEFIYDYLDEEQIFTVPESGIYQLESFGAEGEENGGKGGYVSGSIYLEKGETLKLRTGGTDGSNGGGVGVYNGGGSSTIKYNDNIILAAAGGGGGEEGTDGGSGDGSGGAYKSGAGVTTPDAGVAGQNGINGGGGGSGNIYKDCTGYEQVYNSCLTGENTCEAGYVNGTCNTYKSCSSCTCATYNSCASADCGYVTCRTSACGCETYNSCANAACGYNTCQNAACGTSYSCPGGWNLSGSSCYQGAAYRTLWRWYYMVMNCNCSTGSDISNGAYYNTSTCTSACQQKNGSGTGYCTGAGCYRAYSSWSTSSVKPPAPHSNREYNDSFYETTTEAYCPNGGSSDGTNCWIAGSAYYNTCATSACGNLTCRTSACGCQTYKSCSSAACGNLTCRTSACGCQTYNRCSVCGCETYNQVYSPCATGSNTCTGGYENGSCNSFSEGKYESGHGGSNIIDTNKVTNSISSIGINTSNGRIIIIFKGYK
jgi:general secretion pathway protein G